MIIRGDRENSGGTLKAEVSNRCISQVLMSKVEGSSVELTIRNLKCKSEIQ